MSETFFTQKGVSLFQNDGRTSRSAQCNKSRALTNVVDTIIYIESFERKCVIIKGAFQPEQLKKYMVTIVVDRSLSNMALYENRFLEKIKKFYKYSGKCDDQHQYKAILESEIFSNPEEFTDKIPLSHDQYETAKNRSASNSPHQFSYMLDIKNFCSQVSCC